jgi:hypothetical protein
MGGMRLDLFEAREIDWIKEDVKDVIYDPNIRVAVTYTRKGDPTFTGEAFTPNDLDVNTWAVKLEMAQEEYLMHLEKGGEVGQHVYLIYGPDLTRHGITEPKAGDQLTVGSNTLNVHRASQAQANVFFRIVVEGR